MKIRNETVGYSDIKLNHIKYKGIEGVWSVRPDGIHVGVIIFPDGTQEQAAGKTKGHIGKWLKDTMDAYIKKLN